MLGTIAEPFSVIASVFENSAQDYAVFSEVHPNPVEEDVELAAQIYREEKCDGIIGVDADYRVPGRFEAPGVQVHFVPIAVRQRHDRRGSGLLH